MQYSHIIHVGVILINVAEILLVSAQYRGLLMDVCQRSNDRSSYECVYMRVCVCPCVCVSVCVWEEGVIGRLNT